MVQRANLKTLMPAKRRVITLSEDSLITTGSLRPGASLPLVIQPAVKDVSLLSWAGNNREFIEQQLLTCGAILFRNFNVRTVAEFEQFISAISGQLLEYTYRSTPRTQISGGIYTSTEYPANESIPLHNEMSYASNWPMKIFFFCLNTAETEGQTPIADSGKVFEAIDPAVRETFIKKKVVYVRNYGDGIDLPWKQVFNTTSKSTVEDYCRAVEMGFQWKSGDRLRTWQTCQTVAVHPKTGRSLWFNQAHLFHVSALERQVHNSLLEEFGEEDLPRNALFGDGSPIDVSLLDEIRRAYSQNEVVFDWQERDILMLDNMLVAHGRRPYTGARRIVVGMAEPYSTHIPQTR